ncbi:MAG TPA: ABC transporter substrate-binding protein [Patescibacteria group bacterium]|jgi:putative ABC transport system substrate-binding protein|nr:ABC transporter substrate-binding protein [Patescibacteria group bacterium]
MMRLRAAACFAVLALLVAPLAGLAQMAGRIPRIGIVFPGAPGTSGVVFERSLTERGWAPGQKLIIEYRYATGDVERLPELVAELIGLGVDALLISSQAIPVAARATRSIPIIMTFAVDDPVERGWAASLARPGGNITGITLYVPELTAKRLELLKTILPSLKRVGVLAPLGLGGTSQIKVAETAARSLGLQPHVAGVRGTAEYESAFQALKRDGAEAILMLSSSAFFADRQRLADLAIRHRLPLVSPFREATDAGGLLAYGPNVTELWAKRVPFYVERILTGAKPGELPIEEPSTFELAVNLKTARTLGLTIPQALILRADKVIE